MSKFACDKGLGELRRAFDARLTPSIVVRSAIVLCACVLGMCLTHVARAQELVARELMDLSATSLITIDDIEYLRDAATLSKDQYESAEMLLAGAKAGLEQARRKESRASRAAGLIENDAEQEKARRDVSRQFVEDLAEIEKSFMQDVKGLLTPDQDEGWQRFERMRRRMLIRRTMNLQRVDLVSFLRRAAQGSSVIEQFGDEVDRYEKELDLLIQQRRTIAKDIGRNWYTWKHDGERDDRKAADDIRTIAARICELQARTARHWVELLPEGPREKFATRYFDACFGGVGGSTGRLPVVKEVRQIGSLSSEQEKEMTRIVREADAKKMALNWSFEKSWAAGVVADLRHQESPAEPGDYREKVREIERGVIRDVQAVLTPSQTEAYKDGIDVESIEDDDAEKDRRPD